MGEEPDVTAADEGAPDQWRALWVTAAALGATLALIGLIFLITWSNSARDAAIERERRTYEVMLLTRTIDATIARSEAALGRYVLNEDRYTGTAYYNEWRRAAYQIRQLQRIIRRNPAQEARVDELQRLFAQRNSELAPAATATERRQGTTGYSLLYQAAGSRTLPRLRAKLEEIAAAERESLERYSRQTQFLVDRADTYTDWLGWVAVLIAIGAAGLAVMAFRAFREGLAARREAESEGWRALELDRAVRERTRELSEANRQLQAEAAERAAAEEQLRQVQKMEAVGQLTGGIAHDFNNMLAVVVGGLDLARRRLHGPRREVEFHLNNAMEGATRAAALTRRLLAFARSEPLLPEAVAPAERVEGMLQLIDRAIGERINVHTRFPADHWAIWVDPTQLENALLNLAVNARDAMAGSGELMIEVDNVTLTEGQLNDLAAGDYVRIGVSDTGAGIAPEHLERVFEPFFTTKPVGKGTGLGLTQIFGFARQSGGHATISSTPGEGTRVDLYIPRSLLAEEQLADRGAAGPTPSVERATRFRGATILVVEDDPRVSRSTVAALEELGFRALACTGGVDALEMLDRHPEIDLVVTDVMMPEMTGPELAAAIRRTGSAVPLLFVTGYVGDAGEADELAGADVLRKPFTVAALAQAVETALGHGSVSGSRLASTDAEAI